MLSVPFKRKFIRLGHDRHSVYFNIPKPLLDYLSNEGFDFSDFAEIEVNDKQELILRLNRAKN